MTLAIQDVNEWDDMRQLLLGLSGGGAPFGIGTRSQFLFDFLNLPAIVNEMAAQTLLLNQDRCTKNWFMLLDSTRGEWSRIPWDMEGALGISNSLGGLPASDYCILACEQWNSPLYCDSEHPQVCLKAAGFEVLPCVNHSIAHGRAAAGCT